MSKTNINSSFPRFNIAPRVNGTMLRWILVWLILGFAGRLCYQGKVLELGIIVFGLGFLAYTYRNPFPALVLEILVRCNVFNFLYLNNLFHLQLGPGLRITLHDAMLLGLLGIALLKLYESKEKPLFLASIFAIGTMVCFSAFFGLVTGTTTIKWIMSSLRPMFGWTVYLILIACLDTPARLDRYIKLIFTIIIIAVIIQIIEVSQGCPLPPILGTGQVEVVTQANVSKINISGGAIPYLHNRAIGSTLIGLCLALGAISIGFGTRLSKLIVILSIFALGLSMVRQWYIYIFVGAFVIFILSRKRAKKSLVMFFILAVVVIWGMFAVVDHFREVEGPSLQTAVYERLTMAINPTSQDHFISRADQTKCSMRLIEESPVAGYGMSKKGLHLLNTNLGFINTLIKFGIIGQICILFVIFSVLIKGYRIYKNMEMIKEKSYLLGVLGVWCAMMVGYSFSMDFFTTGTGMVCFCMAVIDRVNAFNKRGLLQRV